MCCLEENQLPGVPIGDAVKPTSRFDQSVQSPSVAAVSGHVVLHAPRSGWKVCGDRALLPRAASFFLRTHSFLI